MASNNQDLTAKDFISKYNELINIQIAAEAMWAQSDRSEKPEHKSSLQGE